jgi:energy-coupling factor transporter transmembrane protein EcfT
MGIDEQYFGIVIVIGLAFLLSLVVFFKIQKKWLGCILQFFTFIALLIFSGMLFGMCRGFVDSSNESEAMVGVQLIEEDRDCRYETKYWMKPDDTYYYEYEKESNKHKVEPCGNDSYSGKGTFICIDSIYAIQARSNPDFIIYFDLDNQKVTPVYGNDTLEVIDINWERIREYFKQQ